MLKKALVVAVPSLLIGAQAQAGVGTEGALQSEHEQARLVSTQSLLNDIEVESVALNEARGAACKVNVGL